MPATVFRMIIKFIENIMKSWRNIWSNTFRRIKKLLRSYEDPLKTALRPGVVPRWRAIYAFKMKKLNLSKMIQS